MRVGVEGEMIITWEEEEEGRNFGRCWGRRGGGGEDEIWMLLGGGRKERKRSALVFEDLEGRGEKTWRKKGLSYSSSSSPASSPRKDPPLH